MGADRAPRTALRSEAGSVLMLLPAAVLVMLVLAAIAVDVAIAYWGQRELANASVAAANDAATLALSDAAFYEGGEVVTDPATVAEIAEERVAAAVDGHRVKGVVVEAEALPPARRGCAWTVVVRARGRVDYVFARAVPGGPDTAQVAATARASPRQGESRC